MKTIYEKFMESLAKGAKNKKAFNILHFNTVAKMVKNEEVDFKFDTIKKLEDEINFNFPLGKALLELEKLMLDKGVKSKRQLAEIAKDKLKYSSKQHFDALFAMRSGNTARIKEIEDLLRGMPDVY